MLVDAFVIGKKEGASGSAGIKLSSRHACK